MIAKVKIRVWYWRVTIRRGDMLFHANTLLKDTANLDAVDSNAGYEFITASQSRIRASNRNTSYTRQLIHITVTLSGSEEYRNGPIIALPPTDEDTL